MKKFFILFLAAVTGLQLSAQQLKTSSPGRKASTVTIQTNGRCERCGKVLEACFKNDISVMSCHYDVKTAKLTLSYDPKATSPDLLRKKISSIGYDADNVKADPKARAKLPECCRTTVKSAKMQATPCNGHVHSGDCLKMKEQTVKRGPAKPAPSVPATK